MMHTYGLWIGKGWPTNEETRPHADLIMHIPCSVNISSMLSALHRCIQFFRHAPIQGKLSNAPLINPWWPD